jgi:Mandelate racemase / muconate lactonizing enzyme, N-terminal domain
MTAVLRIEAIRARRLVLPLARPVETSAAILTATPLVLVDVFTREGVVGCSYASVYSPLALDRSPA